MRNIAIQMQALDDFVTRARSQNGQHHDKHLQSLNNLSTTARNSYDNIGTHFDVSYGRIHSIGAEMSTQTGSVRQTLATLDTTFRQPLAELRDNIASTQMTEYAPTGETPQKTQYLYTSKLPKTDSHEVLLATMRGETITQVNPSPTKSIIFHDPESPILDGEVQSVTVPISLHESVAASTSLREIDINVNRAQSLNILEKVYEPHTENIKSETLGLQKTFKQSISRTGSAGKIPRVGTSRSSKENVPLGNLGTSNGGASRRRSPRTTGT